MGKPEERKETGKRDWGDEEEAAIFSKRVPETRHQKALNFTSQVPPEDLLPQPCVH